MGERILDDAVDRRLDVVRQVRQHWLRAQLHRRAALLRGARQRLERSDETELVEHHGPELPGHVPHLGEHARHLLVELHERRMRPCAVAPLHHPQAEQDRGQDLGEILVQLLGHPPPVGLLRLQEEPCAGAAGQELAAHVAQARLERSALAVDVEQPEVLGDERGLPRQELEGRPVLEGGRRRMDRLEHPDAQAMGVHGQARPHALGGPWRTSGTPRSGPTAPTAPGMAITSRAASSARRSRPPASVSRRPARSNRSSRACAARMRSL